MSRSSKILPKKCCLCQNSASQQHFFATSRKLFLASIQVSVKQLKLLWVAWTRKKKRSKTYCCSLTANERVTLASAWRVRSLHCKRCMASLLLDALDGWTRKSHLFTSFRLQPFLCPLAYRIFPVLRPKKFRSDSIKNCFLGKRQACHHEAQKMRVEKKEDSIQFLFGKLKRPSTVKFSRGITKKRCLITASHAQVGQLVKEKWDYNSKVCFSFFLLVQTTQGSFNRFTETWIEAKNNFLDVAKKNLLGG